MPEVQKSPLGVCPQVLRYRDVTKKHNLALVELPVVADGLASRLLWSPASSILALVLTVAAAGCSKPRVAEASSPPVLSGPQNSHQAVLVLIQYLKDSVHLYHGGWRSTPSSFAPSCCGSSPARVSFNSWVPLCERN